MPDDDCEVDGCGADEKYDVEVVTQAIMAKDKKKGRTEIKENAAPKSDLDPFDFSVPSDRLIVHARSFYEQPSSNQSAFYLFIC